MTRTHPTAHVLSKWTRVDRLAPPRSGQSPEDRTPGHSQVTPGGCPGPHPGRGGGLMLGQSCPPARVKEAAAGRLSPGQTLRHTHFSCHRWRVTEALFPLA